MRGDVHERFAQSPHLRHTLSNLMVVLHYGSNSSVQLEFAEGVSPGESDTPRAQPLADPADALTAALRAPLNYPPLARCTTPVDRIVLAVEPGVPQAAQLTAAVIGVLAETGIAADGITILRSPFHGGAEEDPRKLLASPLRKRIALVTHDPADRRRLAYLAASEAGDAILLNRAVHEADLVLPIGCVRGNETAGYYGIHSGIYPNFSDVKTLQRFRSSGSIDGRAKRRRELTAEVDHVAWLLGVNFSIQVIPGAGDQVLHVLAGESDAVRRQGQDLYRTAWNWPVPRQVSLVVAAIEGGAGQQTWENLGRALEVAGHYVEEGGSIAVCCDLAVPPGPAVQYVAHSSSPKAALRQAGKHRAADVVPAAQLAQALQRDKVYLLSRLEPAVVEDLDMIPLAGPDELARLVHRHPSCILLANAPHVTAVEEHHA